ncbi:hypothetical protein BpHYR1_044642 [Brachionus plicatilis]|uniref:Uncharacterized protein n=1 Tax=Brachionus plicatilis TaxID=10195 RepID=A0A3M7Q863_BRAPC|nr:hypothetical protein BpHYR1_044642 [Brachionus plicatilis]
MNHPSMNLRKKNKTQGATLLVKAMRKLLHKQRNKFDKLKSQQLNEVLIQKPKKLLKHQQTDLVNTGVAT